MWLASFIANQSNVKAPSRQRKEHTMEELTTFLKGVLGVFMLKGMIWLLLLPLIVLLILVKKMSQEKQSKMLAGEKPNSNDKNGKVQDS